jgi:tetratricopeptide (TPR) repeat protein
LPQYSIPEVLLLASSEQLFSLLLSCLPRDKTLYTSIPEWGILMALVYAHHIISGDPNMKLTPIIVGIFAMQLCFATQAVEFQDIERASLHNNRSALTALVAELSDSDNGYVTAYLQFRQAIAAQVDGETAIATKALKRCVSQIEEEISAYGESAESLALLSNCYGILISITPIKGVVLGPKADRAMAKAMNLDPGNPRALMIQGIAKLNTPGLFGGSTEEANTLLSEAIKEFSTDVAVAPYNWGHAEVYVWHAQAQHALGNLNGAIEDLEQALVVEPDYKWAQVLRQQWSAE